MQAYFDIVRKVLEKGSITKNRTGVDTISYLGTQFEHDMAEGFPLLTSKVIPFRLITTENEFFINGITDKKWLQDRNNHIWDEWCTPDKVLYGHDAETKAKMEQERDLGPIYGWQWRHYGAEYRGYDQDYTGEGIDQLENIVNALKTNPGDRRMIVTAWNPKDIPRMALPPCHYDFQVKVSGDKLDLKWNQRSADIALGVPFNIAGYALILHLLAKEAGLKEGKLTGHLGDTHIYIPHLENLEEQMSRELRSLPRVETSNFTSIFEWQNTDSKVIGYKPHPKIEYEVAV